jgi:UDP-N-acetylmuramoyl-tripeptide--D-alanyl-D-alanine ligase
MSMGTLASAARDIGGKLRGTDCSYESVSTDTRTLMPGQLFFALRGERFDAADFVADAATRGAAGAVVEHFTPASLPQVEVADSRLALGMLARKWRQNFSLPMVGITGSNGKTTVKELTAAILRAKFAAAGDDAVLATRGNLNNDVGLPLTLLSLRKQHQAAVIEMGANHPGEIAVLAEIAAVNVALITNAGRAHIEGFGSVEEIARTKGAILDGLSSGGTAVINRDDAFFAYWADRTDAATICSFGLSPQADFRAANIRAVVRSGQFGYEFTLLTPVGQRDAWLPLVGKHNVVNALGAAAAAVSAGATLDDVCAGLRSSSNVPGRLRAFITDSGTTIYDDSYNANPDSVTAAIRFLTELDGESCLVLGDMGELGPDALELHRGIGKLAREAGIQQLWCVGELSRAAAAGFGAGARCFDSVAALGDFLLSELRAGRNVLIKASRFMGLDKLVRRIETTALHEAEG